jgi:hypothetical protein
MVDRGGANCRSCRGSAGAHTHATLFAPTVWKIDRMWAQAFGTSSGIPPFATPDDTDQFLSAWRRTVR